MAPRCSEARDAMAHGFFRCYCQDAISSLTDGSFSQNFEGPYFGSARIPIWWSEHPELLGVVIYTV